MWVRGSLVSSLYTDAVDNAVSGCAWRCWTIPFSHISSSTKWINLLLPNNGGYSDSRKRVSPVEIDVEIAQLLLDARSKANNLQKSYLYFRSKLTAKQGKSMGTVLDPTLERIGKVQIGLQ